jgi:hypothetical protein
MHRPHELVIDDANWQAHVAPVVGGERKGRGHIPRNYASHPQGFYATIPAWSVDMLLIPRDEWADRIRDMEANKSRTSDIRRSSGPGGGIIPSLDQDGVGFCWNHSCTMCIMLTRALMGLPYVRLSAFFIGCLIKDYRDEGGWGAQALDFAIKNGVPAVQFWPEKSMSRSCDNAATRQNALLHKPTEIWADLADADYDRNLTEDQAMTALLCRNPVVGDFNWWGHSVCLMDPVMNLPDNHAIYKTDFGSLDLREQKDARLMADAFGKRGLNSWTDAYGDKGEFILAGSRALLNGGCAVRVVSPGNA